MNQFLALCQRAIKEQLRTPEQLIPTIFIPVFFLVVNVGQAARIFPAGNTSFLRGQNYGAFQVPSALLLGASFGAAAQFLVEEIEGGYFDKLRASPVPRAALVLGRLAAEGIKIVGISAIILLASLVFGVRIATGVPGFVLLLLLSASWAAVFSGFVQLIALKTRSAAATQSGSLIFFPLLFLTPNFVPRPLLSHPMKVAATFNPVTYLIEALRSLLLEHWDWATIGWGFLVVGLAGVLMVSLNLRAIRSYD